MRVNVQRYLPVPSPLPPIKAVVLTLTEEEAKALRGVVAHTPAGGVLQDLYTDLVKAGL